MTKVHCSDSWIWLTDGDFRQARELGIISDSSQHPQMPLTYSFDGTVAELYRQIRPPAPWPLVAVIAVVIIAIGLLLW